MEEKIGFFTRSQSTAALNKFKNRMDGIHAPDDFQIARNSHIQTIIHSMANSPDQWDEYCEINIGWIGDQFISRISDGSEGRKRGR